MPGWVKRRRLLEDQQGIALPVAIFVMVIVMTMGAGLLIYVTRDLQTAAEANRGQQAFGVAEAGIEVGKREIGQKCADGECDELLDKTINVTLPDTSGAAKIRMTEIDPEELDFELGANESAFSVVSEGNLNPEAESRNAQRKVQAQFIVSSEDDGGVPPQLQNIQTDGDFEVNGAATLNDAMVHAEGDTIIASSLTLNNTSFYNEGDFSVNPRLTLDDASVFTGEDGDFTVNDGYGNLTVRGEDPFGDWQSEYNETPRETSNSGIGVGGRILKSQWSADMPGFDDGGTQQHYDSTTDPAMNEGITYPFDPEALASKEPDLETLREVARSQSNFAGEEDNYIEVGEEVDDVGLGNNGDNGDLGLAWPDDTSLGTVVFVSFQGDDLEDNMVSWREYGDCDDIPEEAVIVVENGGFQWAGGLKPLHGAIITASENFQEVDEGIVDINGELCNAGPIYAGGTIDLDGSGNSNGTLSSEEYEQLPPGIPGASSSLSSLGWRECYTDADCGSVDPEDET